jgi:hypothetical protein
MKKSVEELSLQHYPDESYPIGDRDRIYDPNYKERLAFIKGMRAQEERSCAPEMLEALKRSLKELEMFADNTPPFTRELKKLIKKVTEL